MNATAPRRFRRFRDTRHGGSGLPSTPMTYGIVVFGRHERRIVGAFQASTLAEAFLIVRELGRRYPTRLVALSRTIHRGNTRTDPTRPAFAVPDHAGFRILTPWGRPVAIATASRGGFATGGRRRTHSVRVRPASDVLAALRGTGRLTAVPLAGDVAPPLALAA